MLDEIIYFKQIENYPTITKEKQKSLFLKLKGGDISVREEIICGNLKLVIRTVNYFEHFGHKQDLISERNIGLMEAVDRFDPKKGNQFSTYATFWIRQKILAYLNQKVDTVRLPSFLNQRIRKMNIIKQEFFNKFGREPDDEEICEMLDIRSKSLEYMKNSMNLNSSEIPVHKSNQFIGKDIFEMEDIEKYWNLNIIDQYENPSKFEDTETNELNIKALQIALESLEGRDARIMHMRFFQNLTLRQIAEKMHVTTERIRQIETKILRNIRAILKKNEVGA